MFVVDVVVGTCRLGEGLQPSAVEIVTAVTVCCGVQGIFRAVGNGCVAYLDKSVFNYRVVGIGGGALFCYVAVAVVLVHRSVVVHQKVAVVVGVVVAVGRFAVNFGNVAHGVVLILTYPIGLVAKGKGVHVYSLRNVLAVVCARLIVACQCHNARVVFVVDVGVFQHAQVVIFVGFGHAVEVVFKLRKRCRSAKFR